ncbi:hypothetical protein GGX14DRAFT_405853 [Mycena pura]|uniref:Uncharacterized protein n=1 Tax=Mycena pura TaxID=153505 RepID=A0AAD6Y256_9AGAR|nr:hypothetical protein GGX14DRAFT_405853 [Mycena pura]
MPRVLEWQTFGAPVPQFPFMHPDSHGGAKPKTRSTWMYPTERPEKGMTGRTMGQPDAQRLPLLPQQESSDPTDTDVPMKVEPVVTQADEDSVDDDLGGMDLDDLDAEDSSTRIVVIDGLPTESSTSSFHEVTRSLFFRAGVSPMKVVWHAGRMWVLMKDVREGQRAMGALAELPGDRRISFGREDECSRAVGLSSDVWIGSGAEGDRVVPAPTSSSGAIATPPPVESLDALRTGTPAEVIPAESVPASAGSVPETVGLHTSAITDSSMEDSLEAPRALLEPLAESPAPPPVNEPSRPPSVNESSMDSDVERQLGDEGIFRLFAPSLRALTRRPSSPIRLPPSAPRAMRTAVPAKVPSLPAPVEPPSLAARMADPAPFWTRIGPQERPSQSRLPPARSELLDRLSSEAPVPLLSRFSTPPPAAGPSLLHRMGDSTTLAAPPTAKRPRSPSPVEPLASPQAPAPRKARRGMRGGETARQQRARRAERERLLALELSATASTSSAPLTSLSSRLLPSVASTLSAPRTSLSARLQPSGRAAPSTGSLLEMDQALMEADWTLTQAEAAAPLDRIDLDEEHTWNDPSITSIRGYAVPTNNAMPASPEHARNCSRSWPQEHQSVRRAGLRGGERPHVTLPLSAFTLSLSAFNGSRLQSTSGLCEALGRPRRITVNRGSTMVDKVCPARIPLGNYKTKSVINGKATLVRSSIPVISKFQLLIKRALLHYAVVSFLSRFYGSRDRLGEHDGRNPVHCQMCQLGIGTVPYQYGVRLRYGAAVPVPYCHLAVQVRYGYGTVRNRTKPYRTAIYGPYTAGTAVIVTIMMVMDDSQTTVIPILNVVTCKDGILTQHPDL